MQDLLQVGLDAIKAVLSTAKQALPSIENSLRGIQRVRGQWEIMREVSKIEQLCRYFSTLSYSQVRLSSYLEKLEEEFDLYDTSDWSNLQREEDLSDCVCRCLRALEECRDYFERLDSRTIVFDPKLSERVAKAIVEREYFYQKATASDYGSVKSSDIALFRIELGLLVNELNEIRDILVEKLNINKQISEGRETHPRIR